MTPHTVAVTFTTGRAACVTGIDALDPVHAVLQFFARLPVEQHVHVLKINVSPDILPNATS